MGQGSFFVFFLLIQAYLNFPWFEMQKFLIMEKKLHLSFCWKALSLGWYLFYDFNCYFKRIRIVDIEGFRTLVTVNQ